MHETIAPNICAGSYVSTIAVVRMTGFASPVRAYFSQVRQRSSITEIQGHHSLSFGPGSA
jgi:hypothetical protein